VIDRALSSPVTVALLLAGVVALLWLIDAWDRSAD
jgi:hypothetical protein